MKLLFVLEDLLVGGAQLHSLDLAERLRARGFEVALLVLGAAVEPSLADRAGGALGVLAQAGLRHPGEWRRLARAIRGSGATVVFAVGPVAACVAALARRPGRGAPAVVAVHHATDVVSAAGWVRTAPFLIAARTLEGLVFVSERQAAHWGRRGLRARRTRVIRNGVDLGRYPAVTGEARAAAKVALGLDAAAFTLGAVAMFRPEKNHVGMVRALDALARAGVAAELVLVGDGPTRAAVEAEVCRCGLQRRVRFCGAQADVRPFLAALDAGVLASTRVETLPLFGLELMAGGAPLVAPRIGGLEELVQDGVDGLLFERGDAGGLACQLRRCAEPALRVRLAAAARPKAQRFCVEAMADAYASLAAEVAPAPGPAA